MCGFWCGEIYDLWSWLSIVMVCLSKFGFKGILKNVDKKFNLWSLAYIRGCCEYNGVWVILVKCAQKVRSCSWRCLMGTVLRSEYFWDFQSSSFLRSWFWSRWAFYDLSPTFLSNFSLFISHFRSLFLTFVYSPTKNQESPHPHTPKNSPTPL